MGFQFVMCVGYGNVWRTSQLIHLMGYICDFLVRILRYIKIRYAVAKMAFMASKFHNMCLNWNRTHARYGSEERIVQFRATCMIVFFLCKEHVCNF